MGIYRPRISGGDLCRHDERRSWMVVVVSNPLLSFYPSPPVSPSRSPAHDVQAGQGMEVRKAMPSRACLSYSSREAGFGAEPMLSTLFPRDGRWIQRRTDQHQELEKFFRAGIILIGSWEFYLHVFPRNSLTDVVDHVEKSSHFHIYISHDSITNLEV